jgi:hypothetical protein
MRQRLMGRLLSPMLGPLEPEQRAAVERAHGRVVIRGKPGLSMRQATLRENSR